MCSLVVVREVDLRIDWFEDLDGLVDHFNVEVIGILCEAGYSPRPKWDARLSCH